MLKSIYLIRKALYSENGVTISCAEKQGRKEVLQKTSVKAIYLGEKYSMVYLIPISKYLLTYVSKKMAAALKVWQFLYHEGVAKWWRKSFSVKEEGRNKFSIAVWGRRRRALLPEDAGGVWRKTPRRRQSWRKKKKIPFSAAATAGELTVFSHLIYLSIRAGESVLDNIFLLAIINSSSMLAAK